VLAALVYAGVRVFTEGDGTDAVANGRRILRLEHTLHIDWESTLQAQVLAHEWLARLANWIYIWGFWPVLAGAAVFLYARHRDTYVLLRNAIFISGLIGFLFFALLPVAPPRLADPRLVDTIREHTTWYRTVVPLKLTNQYAAMPSLHLGWSLLVGVALARGIRRPAAYTFAVLMPTAMALTVVVTANHYVADVVVGGAVAATSLLLASRLPRRLGLLRRLEQLAGDTIGVGHFEDEAVEALVAKIDDEHLLRPSHVPELCSPPEAPGTERDSAGDMGSRRTQAAA
jgi:membrane-associated phospholipid phosphatase